MTGPTQQSWWRDSLLWLALALVPAALAGWLHPQRPAFTWQRPAVAEIPLFSVHRLPTPLLWVDARSTQAYKQSRIPGAILCNEENWEQLLPGLLEAWQPGATLVVYCDAQTCTASQAVATRLKKELALTNIYVLQGGWAAWKKAQP